MKIAFLFLFGFVSLSFPVPSPALYLWGNPYLDEEYLPAMHGRDTRSSLPRARPLPCPVFLTDREERVRDAGCVCISPVHLSDAGCVKREPRNSLLDGY